MILICKYKHLHLYLTYNFSSAAYVTLDQDRPSTKVKSVPGGDSSLGYLFGDK